MSVGPSKTSAEIMWHSVEPTWVNSRGDRCMAQGGRKPRHGGHHGLDSVKDDVDYLDSLASTLSLA